MLNYILYSKKLLPKALKLNNNIISVLDIGTSKTVCLIARCSGEDDIEVLGFGHQFSQGIKAGVITDIDLAEESVRAAVASAEESAQLNIENIVVNVSGNHLKCTEFEATYDIDGHEISNKEIKQLVTQAIDEFQPDEQEVIHCFPISYDVDGASNIENPVGMYCKKLTIKLNIITVHRSIVMNINKCMARCHLNIEGFIASSYASAVANLDKNYAKIGATVIDFGAGTTSISVIKDNNLTFLDIVPYGGAHITNDIAIGLSTTTEIAERVKNLHGNVIDSDKDTSDIIELCDSNEDDYELKQILKSELISIIRPRAEEIIEIIEESIKKIGLANIGSKILITGGASQLYGIDKMVEQICGKPAIIAFPKKLKGLEDKVQSGGFSTSIGTLIICARKINNNKFSFEDSIINNGVFRKIIDFFKKFI